MTASITLLAQTKEMCDSVILSVMPLLTPRSPPPQGGACATCHCEEEGPVSSSELVITES